MLARYLAIVGRRDPMGSRQSIEARALALPGMRRIIATSGLKLYTDAPEPCLLENGGGAILGPLFRRARMAAPVSGLTLAEAEAILASRGQLLIDDFWGGYVAFLADAAAGEAAVLRAPFGELDCVHVDQDGLIILASDLALLRECAGFRAACDWPMVAAHLSTTGLRHEQTCVAGVRELLWGTRLVLDSDSVRVEDAWSPWHFARRRDQNCDPDAAEVQLRETARTCIAARASRFDHVLVMLSGGLDSSILAWCVAQSRTAFSCLNLTTGDPTGDERDYARLVAKALGAELLEAAHDIGDVDVAHSAAAHLPRPVARAFAQATRRRKLEAARRAGATAIFDGGGGDNLFCFLQSVAPVADRLRVEGVGAGAWQSACDMARLAETNVVTVALRAMRRAWLRSPAWRWPIEESFMAPGVASAMAGRPTHRWLTPTVGALPGSAAHIALLIAVENLLETVDGPLPELSPLMAQPLVEHCLTIPSWMWCAQGRDRMVARRAFAHRLPAEIVDRRSKGTPDGFVAALFDANRAKLTELLADGVLAENSLVDRQALLAALADTRPLKGHDYVRILRIADVEAWARSI